MSQGERLATEASIVLAAIPPGDVELQRRRIERRRERELQEKLRRQFERQIQEDIRDLRRQIKDRLDEQLEDLLDELRKDPLRPPGPTPSPHQQDPGGLRGPPSLRQPLVLVGSFPASRGAGISPQVAAGFRSLL